MRYRTIDVRMWGDTKFRSLTPLLPSGQALFLYLLTNPNTTNIPGLYRAGAAALAEELGWSIEDFGRAFDECIKQDLVKADFSSRVIFIPNAIKFNKPQAPNVVKSWAAHWDEIPECELKTFAYETLHAFVKGISEAFVEAFHHATGKSLTKTMPIQEQDQEQEQNQEQDTKNTNIEIFEHWKSVMNHPLAKFDNKRQKVINTALKLGFSVEELKQAINGCANSDWHMGKNERKRRFDDISLVLRNAEKIESFIALAVNPRPRENIIDIVSQLDHMAEGAI